MNFNRILILSLLVIFSSLSIHSCKQYVCPAYQSSFLATEEDARYFFSYAQDDSILFQNDLMASRERLWNGLVRARPYTLGLPPKRPSQDQDFAEVIFQEKRFIIPDSVLEVIKDSTFYLTKEGARNEAVLDDVPLDDFVADEDLQTDTTDENAADLVIAEADSSNVRPEPPMRYDQYYYMLNYGEALMEADSMRQATKADSLAKQHVLPDSLMINPNRKKWQFWKPKYVSSDTSSIVLADTLSVEEETGGRKKGFNLFKKSKEEESDEEEINETSSPDEDW